MGKKTSQKFITLTAIAMCILMVAYVATMFITIDVRDYDDVKSSSEFINNIHNGSVKLDNENYSLKEVTCSVDKTGEEIDLSALKGSDKDIKTSLIEKMNYDVITRDTNKSGDESINIMADSDKSLNLKWTAYTSSAELIWFPQHPTVKHFISSMKSNYYNEYDVEYDINDVVLFPVILFVFGLAGAVLVVKFKNKSFFLAFPIFWCILGILSYISGFSSSTVPQFFIFTILKDLSPALYTVQFVLILLVLAAVVFSFIFRKAYKKAVAAEEASYYGN